MKMTKRILSLVLALAMMLGLMPALGMSVVPKANAATVAGYISLPITIRDYADDGMLFDFNELGDKAGVVSSANPSMAHNRAPFDPTYRILNGGSGWAVTNGTANGSTAATSALNGYQTFTTSSDTNKMTLTYTLPTDELKYQNRVSDLGYIVLTFQSSAGTVPGSITLTDSTGATYTASLAAQASGAAASYDTGFIRAYYKLDDPTAKSAPITSVTINTDHVSGQQTITNAGEVDYVYNKSAKFDMSNGQYYIADPDSGYALDFVNGTLQIVKLVSASSSSVVADEKLTATWELNRSWVYYLLSGVANALAYNNGIYTTANFNSDTHCVWTVTQVDTGFTFYNNNAKKYLYIDANGSAALSSSQKVLGVYTYSGTTPEEPEYGEGSGPATFSVMEMEFYDKRDEHVAQLRCMETDGYAVQDANGNSIVQFWSALGNTHDNNTYTLWTTIGNNKNFGFLQSDNITSSDPQSGANTDDTVENVNTNMMDDRMPHSEYHPSGTYTITLPNGARHTISGSMIRTGLTQMTLDANKDVVYAEGTVDYLAMVLQDTLAYEEYAVDGAGVLRRNFSYVIGTKVVEDEHGTGAMDLATAIRNQLGADPDDWKMGTYAEAMAKHDAGRLNAYTDIATVYDAAYFLLHNLYADSNGYGVTVDNYNELRMNHVSADANGNAVYRFDSHYGVDYGTTNAGVIVNTDTTSVESREFNPLYNLGYGQTGSVYNQEAGIKVDEYQQYNFNYTMEGHAKFIYYYDDELYFQFSGDDDVYLFINDQLVLDLGAVHGTSEGKVNLNEIAAMCGLEDGEPYDFDFYYMERHGVAADFSIETNIQIVDPAMLTQKTGYQNGTEVGYNGFINPALPVNYSFQLTNNGEAPLKDLQFIDADIAVTLNPSGITLNNETQIADLLVAIYNADGSAKEYVAKGSLTEEKLKELLASGIGVGERIIIHGFKYTVPENKWTQDNSSGSTYFNNTVQTIGTAHYQNAADEVLNGVASYRVQKPIYSFEKMHYYAWGKLNTENPTQSEFYSVTAYKEELLKLVNTANITSALTSLSNITITGASGNAANANSRAKVNTDGSITYTPTATGVDNFYFTCTGNDNGKYGPVRVTVYTYGVADNAYVLDYSLPVELNGVNFGLTTNDVIYLAENTNQTNVSINIGEFTSHYGTFKLGAEDNNGEKCFNGQSLKYTMSKFMNGVDTASITVVVKEGETTDNRTNGITMTQKVEVVPASVVYYEDDFVDITYVNSVTDDGTGNVWAEYVGSNGSGTEQSADQNLNYGSDPNYSNDQKWGALTLDENELKNNVLAGYSGFANKVFENLDDSQKAMINGIVNKLLQRYGQKLDGTASNGTIHELILSPGTKNSEIMYFDFMGTGFELISRATQDCYAVLTVRVQEGTPNEDGTFTIGDANGDGTTTSKVVPVITESEGGDVYEVPIIKIDGLPYSNYKVTLSASNTSTSNGNREIYIDGIRIYNPLGDGTMKDAYYAADEAKAEFLEIRPLIVNDGKIVYMDIAESLTFGTGTTVVEDLSDDVTGSNFQVATSDTSDYLKLGPNNEIYLDAPAANAMASILAFYVTKDANVDDSHRTLQIGVHRKIDGTDTGATYFVYGSTPQSISDGIVVDGMTVNYFVITSGTEQYITIDPANLSFDNSGKALVLVGTIGGESPVSNVLALTNIKVAGYTIDNAGKDLANAAALSNTALEENELVQTGFTLRKMLMAAPEENIPEETVPEETVPEKPENAVNKKLTVKNVQVAKKRVKSGSAVTLTVTTSAGAKGLVILDEKGNEVECTVKSSVSSSNGGMWGWTTKLFGGRFGGSANGKTVFTVTLTVKGKPRENKSFEIYAVDEKGALSGNSQTARITIR